MLLPTFSKLVRYLSACIGADTPPAPPLSAPPSLSFLAADDFILTCLTRYCSLLSRNLKTFLCPDEVNVLDVEDEREVLLTRSVIMKPHTVTQDSITISNYDNNGIVVIT